MPDVPAHPLKHRQAPFRRCLRIAGQSVLVADHSLRFVGVLVDSFELLARPVAEHVVGPESRKQIDTAMDALDQYGVFGTERSSKRATGT